MAGLVGWWGSTGVRSNEMDCWFRAIGSDSGLKAPLHSDVEACLPLPGPDACLTTSVEGVEVILLGRARWKGALADANAVSDIARAYKSRGSDVLSDLRGQFLVCILDRVRTTGLVAIDRVGRFPLAYCVRGSSVVFGTDARHVAKHPLIGAGISDQAVFNYLYAHMVPSPYTVFEGVEKLEPGHFLSLSAEGGAVKRYWHMPYGVATHNNFEKAAGQFRDLLKQGVDRCMGSDSLGTFLSGGTDSSTVSGLVSQLAGKPAEAYSMGFDAQGFDETEYARLAASKLGCNLHEYYVTPDDVCDAIPLVAAAYDEPFGNASAVPAYLCAKRASQDGKKILLAGDGGDEIFGGNARYAKQKVFEAYWSVPEPLRRGALEPIVLRTPFFGRGPLAKIRSYVNQAKVPLPDRLESYNFLERENIRSVFTEAFLSDVNPEQPAEIARRSYAEAPDGQSVNQMMHLDLKQTLADNDLRKVVKTCALAGVEVRFPLLDDDLVEFAATLPEHWKVKGLKLRWFFKEALKDFLPREILTKSKHGFGLPFGLWMTTHPRLQALAYDSLARLKGRDIIKPAYLDSIVDQHRSGHASYYGVMIWVLMMLDHWFEANTGSGSTHRKGTGAPSAMIEASY